MSINTMKTVIGVIWPLYCHSILCDYQHTPNNLNNIDLDLQIFDWYQHCHKKVWSYIFNVFKQATEWLINFICLHWFSKLAGIYFCMCLYIMVLLCGIGTSCGTSVVLFSGGGFVCTSPPSYRQNIMHPVVRTVVDELQCVWMCRKCTK